MPRNPFHYLYVGERVSAEDFTDIFSTELVKHALPLFQPGHVVLTGANGMGKSMLFKLLSPDVRIAYHTAGKLFPVPEEASAFIGAGINVNTARCNEFGNRRTAEGEHIQELMFGDFLNYFVVLDILSSIEKLSAIPEITTKLGLTFGEAEREHFAHELSQDLVWQSYLLGCVKYADLKRRMQERINLYRRYMNGNDQALSAEVASTKSSAGQPMKITVKCLRECGIVPQNVNFFILIDQYEELATITGPDGGKADYRSVVNKLLNSRDPTLSYRIGTRGYGWRDHLRIFGTDARLEVERDFKLVELDVRLRRQEKSDVSIFRDFARDVFERRINHAARIEQSVMHGLTIANVFGASFSPPDEARMLAGSSSSDTYIRSESEWPSAATEYLHSLAKDDPLSARLGEAWFRQKGPIVPSENEPPPWDEKPYWRKERNELALLQIAGACRQRGIVAGEDDIIGLSGGNILIFLSLCQLIWDFASQASRREDKIPEIPLGWQLQTIGAFRAARNWLDRVPSEYGRSHDRYRLIQKLGEKFADLLLSDRKMSNPGQNGVSLEIEELQSRTEIYRILIEAVDYGNLVMSEHANRSGRRRRMKFYLNPLYCPIFRIPYQRTKEPLYLSIAQFEEWLAEAHIIEMPERPARRRGAHHESDAPLLDLLGE